MSETISPNTTIAQYFVISKIGEGGMGEVYRARDTKLGRDVAIKVLPAAFSADAERLRRFEQEAQATGALNHPNILVIFHIGTHDGAPYIVSELLEGETLRERMASAALPQRKAIDYVLQIAHGLAAAHAKGIVHRDLKPENLFITNDGRVKILDFGLAKLTGAADGNLSQTEVPTRRVDTDPGLVMGTMGYMSPEQLKGRPADHRSDIFAFGAILYEMLSGKRAFRGESMAETMSAILREDPPDLSETNKTVSPSLERVIHHCLEKNPEERFHSARDLAFAIENLSGAATSSGQTMTMAGVATATEGRKIAGMSRLFGNARLGWIVAALFLLALVTALGLALLYVRQPSPEAQVARFSINLPPGTTTVANTAPVLALSPDGRRLVFGASDAAGKNQLWLRPLDSFATQPLSGTDGAAFPFWSPDGRHIAFFVDNKLKKLDVGSGVIETICQAGSGQGGDWNRQGVILFSEGDGTGLSRVNAAGGKPEGVTEMDAAHEERVHNFPSFLPDGKHYLFHIRGGDNPGIYVGSLDARDRKLLIPLSADGANATRAVWSPQGYILYALNRTTLLARAFDPNRLELRGEPFRVADNVIVSQAGNARFAVSANGVLAFIQGGAPDIVQLTWHDRNDKRLGVIGPAAPWLTFRLSPDERFAALIRDEPNRLSSLWLLDLLQGATTRFITEGNNNEPVWSPDGKQLAFSSARNSPPTLFLKPLTGNVPEERLLQSRFQSFPVSWSPDGKSLIYGMFSPLTRGDIWLLPLSGERKPQPLVQTKSNERFGRVSPDGNWLVYQSDESGSNEIYVTQFPQPARSWR
ncbi:MAG: serine/threonine-protein kinase, partial [Pyrinomonadaceae bacterium]|nr:serine/threonine-protein kinase [Pyrinomonadaceae bacterium]